MNRRIFWVLVRWTVFTVTVALVSLVYSDDPFIVRLVWAGFGGVLYILLYEGYEYLARRGRAKRA